MLQRGHLIYRVSVGKAFLVCSLSQCVCATTYFNSVNCRRMRARVRLHVIGRGPSPPSPPLSLCRNAPCNTVKKKQEEAIFYGLWRDTCPMHTYVIGAKCGCRENEATTEVLDHAGQLPSRRGERSSRTLWKVFQASKNNLRKLQT